MYENFRPFPMYSNFKNTIIAEVKRGVYLEGKKYIKNLITSKYFSKYGKIMYVRGDNNGRVLDWIKKYDNNYDKRGRINDTSALLEDALFMFTIDDNTIVIVVNEYGKTFNRNTGPNSYKIIIFGKYFKKYYKELKDIIKNNSFNNLYQFNVSGKPYNSSSYYSQDETTNQIQQSFFTSTCRDLPLRKIDTLFYNKGVKEYILNHIDGFLDTEHIYSDRNLLYKTGILLYGEPGTGKTSLVTALANYYNMSLIVIDMNSFETLDIYMLSSYLSNDNLKYIILLEDIDCIFDKLDRESGSDKEERKNINKILQFLDSSSSPTDVIFIATTNHINKLDSAITRKGRFDKIVNIKPITKDVAKDMCRSFDVPEEDIEDIIYNLDNNDGLYNQSYLQDSILEYFKKKMRKDLDKEFAEEESINE